MKYDAADLRAIEGSGRLDADESVFFARQLEHIKGRTYDVKRPQLSALKLMPVSTETPEGASVITYRQYDSVGMAKVIASYANDLPRADVTGKEYSVNVRSIGNAYGYSVQEIRSAIFAGVPLTSKKAMAAVRAQEEAVNKIAFAGDDENGLVGLVSNPNVPEVTIQADGSGSSKTFASKTPQQIVRDINSVVNKIVMQTKGVHRANEVWLPIEQYTLIATTQNSTASDKTILEFLRNANPDIEFLPVPELDGAGAGGADRMYAMENSVDNWQLEIPMMIRQHPPQQKGLEFEVAVESRIGGVIIEYPLAMAYADGI